MVNSMQTGKGHSSQKTHQLFDSIPSDESQNLYGIMFAAACDFSKAALDAFREKIRTVGVTEAHLWGKGEIEDMLFQPKNDYLRFAYFGISLQVRRHSLRTDVRARVATKRRALINQYISK
jgi:hypothetical protein